MIASTRRFQAVIALVPGHRAADLCREVPDLARERGAHQLGAAALRQKEAIIRIPKSMPPGTTRSQLQNARAPDPLDPHMEHGIPPERCPRAAARDGSLFEARCPCACRSRSGRVSNVMDGRTPTKRRDTLVGGSEPRSHQRVDAARPPPIRANRPRGRARRGHARARRPAVRGPNPALRSSS
jgi:hypothetical protein